MDCVEVDSRLSYLEERAMTLHPALKSVSELIGTWRGTGRGEYPTIDAFEYTEQVTFAEAGKPFLVYVQKTWSPERAPDAHGDRVSASL